jgi:sigma-54 specific flagellar transcriptional regulator A
MTALPASIPALPTNAFIAASPDDGDRVRSLIPRLTLRLTSMGKIVGAHDSIKHVLDTIGRVASSSCTVLVTGESGTGKELVVAALHDASRRASRPLVAINCGAIPESLIESELFGHAKGAFTGAYATRQGRVAAAEGGTLFLDEIGELPLAVQVKLLRLLQQREYSPVGDSRTMKCDIRIVVATNRDLEKEVIARTFREDLYYRLDVVHVHLPALRERKSDIPLLATHFLRLCTARAGRKDLVGFSSEAMDALSSFGWPGNIRALENAIESSVLLARGPVIGAEDLPARLRREESQTEADGGPALPEGGIDLRAAVESYENGLIRQALARTGGNKMRAAALLGINRTTLVEMVRRKGLESPPLRRVEPG